MNVLWRIRENEPISRNELTKLTGLTPAAMTGIVRDLLDGGMIKETGLGNSVSGRRPIKLVLNNQAGTVLGIEVNRSSMTIGKATLKQQPHSIRSIPLQTASVEQCISELVSYAQQAVHYKSDREQTLWAVGIAFPGLVDVHTGIIKRSTNLGSHWSGVPLKSLLEKALGIPVFIESNVNAAVLGEKWYGDGRKYLNMVYINFGEGISGGIIVEDRLLPVFEGYPGAVGHKVVQIDGPLCTCGNRGCLEAICGILALMRKVTSELPKISDADPLKAIAKQREVTIQDVLETANVAGSYSEGLLRDVGKYIGRAVADVINLYRPDAVFLGGKLLRTPSGLLADIQSEVAARSFPEFARDAKVVCSQLADNAGVFGACALALQGALSSRTANFTA